jgi:hypothetical protein
LVLWQSTFKRMEEWMKPDTGALESLQGAAQTWMTHRLEDFQKGIEASRRMAECKDFGEAAAIQQKWLAECTQRLVADWTALMTPAAWQSAQPGAPKKAAE